MDRNEIMDILPHREHMLLVDSAELVDGVAHGKKHITGDEFFLKGHFPGNPIVPGVILCEIMAQSACVLIKDSLPEASSDNISTLFTGLDKVRFKRPVKPGDTVETECVITKSRAPFYWANGNAFVDGELAASAEFSFAVIIGDTQKE